MSALDRLRKKQASRRYSSFVFPSYGMELKFRKMDVIDESIAGRIPPFLAEKFMAKLKNESAEVSFENMELQDEDIKQWVMKAYEMMLRLKLQPLTEEEEEGRVEKILDENGEVLEVKALSNLPPLEVLEFLEESPLTQQEIQDIPTQEKMAWLMAALADINSMETFSGGIVTTDEVVNFPSEGTQRIRTVKRASNSKNV